MRKLTKILFVLVLLLFIAGCGITFLGKEEVSQIRRCQQFTAIESGVPMEKKKLHVSGGYQCAVEKPEILEFYDTTIEGLGTTTVTTTLSFTTSYESLHALNLNIVYAPLDLFSFGLLLDMSFGKIFSDTSVNSVIRNNLYEGSIFFRFAINLKRFTLGVRPELMLTTVNYHHLFFNEYSHSSENTKKLYPQLSFRNSIFARATLFEPIAVFVGFQLRTLPYAITNKDIEHDIHTGIYTGISFHLANIVYIDPYFALPFRSIFSRFRGSNHMGIRLTLDLLRYQT